MTQRNERWTKGPWKVNPGHPSIWTLSGTPIGVTKRRDDSYATTEDKANALLCAASPDLAEVAIEFVEMFTNTKKYPDPETIVTGLRILFPKAMKAIRKARGEE